MTYLNKQVFNCKARHGVTSAQSREHQRAWSERAWQLALEKGNYDKARQHLNYEIAKGGKIQKIDTSKSMPQRMAEMLAARGIKDPNVGRKNPNVRTVVDFIFSGSPEQMRRLAFGDQNVVLKPGNNVENIDVRYTPEFEQWTKDIYNFVAGHWGEENIIGFYVHGDETTPHIHATIVPVKDGRINYKGVFVGDVDDKIALSRNVSKLHDELSELNARYGLERGSSLTSKRSKSMQTLEWRRRIEDLGREKELELAEMDEQLAAARQELKMAETRVKGLQTMVSRQEEKKTQLEIDLKELQRKIRNNEGDRNALEKQMEDVLKKLKSTETALADKQEKLAVAEEKLQAARDEEKRLSQLNSEMQRMVDSLSEDAYTASGIHLRNTMLDMVISEFLQMKAVLPPDQRPPLEGSTLEMISKKGVEVLHCARLLAVGLINDATTFAQGHGGGGGGDDFNWGREEDEDDKHWRKRCVSMACHMMKPSVIKCSRSR